MNRTQLGITTKPLPIHKERSHVDYYDTKSSQSSPDSTYQRNNTIAKHDVTKSNA